jgi:hypothetical protein
VTVVCRCEICENEVEGDAIVFVRMVVLPSRWWRRRVVLEGYTCSSCAAMFDGVAVAR